MKTPNKYYIFKSITRDGDSMVEFQAYAVTELNEVFTAKELADLAKGKVIARNYKPTDWVVQVKIATVEAGAKALGM
jgi:O-acetylhomoserine/O-acetylserine sulfhydrylase-like pyridoxal-dependent enzyme